MRMRLRLTAVATGIAAIVIAGCGSASSTSQPSVTDRLATRVEQAYKAKLYNVTDTTCVRLTASEYRCLAEYQGQRIVIPVVITSTGWNVGQPRYEALEQFQEAN